MKLGILGGGQLARMMALAAYPLNIKTICLDATEGVCASDVTRVYPLTEQHDDSLAVLRDVDAVTIETENIDLALASKVASDGVLYPSLKAIEITQERLLEKSFLQSQGIPTAAFCDVSSQDDMYSFIKKHGLPVILKTRRLGYDGKGQMRIHALDDVPMAWQTLLGQPVILEAFVPFDYEVSLISVRSREGELRYYPLVRNHHEHGILRYSDVLTDVSEYQAIAESYAKKIMTELNYVGVLTIECFVSQGQLLVNELAPRVHNSGHWTIEGAVTSQFENHVRAVCGLPLGDTSRRGYSYMWNGIGHMPPREACLAIPGLHYHDYNKAAKANRKIGHITITAESPEALELSKNNFIACLQG